MDLLIFGSIVLFVSACLWFVLSVVLKNSSVADIAWGFNGALIAGVMLVKVENPSIFLQLVSWLIILWGVRLGLHIGVRKIGETEDPRYQKWREKWGDFFLIRSFWQNFVFQAFLMLVLLAPVFVAGKTEDSSLSTIAYFGVIIWVFGFIFETVADLQLKKFIKNRKKADQIMSKGLWKYSRHPNYFGEVIQWWGIWLIVVGLSYGLIAVVSPLLITVLILFVSGVPLLEERYKDNEAFQKYAKKTSVFFPMPPKGDS